MAMAIGMVLNRKYVTAMPMSGAASLASPASGEPPSRTNTCPDTSIVRTRMDMLKSVRYVGLPVFALNVDWAQPLTAPSSMVVCGPRMITAAMSMTYDTDMFEPLAIGNCTLKAEVSADRTTKNKSGRMGENSARGR